MGSDGMSRSCRLRVVARRLLGYAVDGGGLRAGAGLLLPQEGLDIAAAPHGARALTGGFTFPKQ